MEPPPKKKCSVCPHSSSRKQDLDTNLKIHKETIIPCGVKCGYESKSKYEAAEHMKTHIKKNFNLVVICNLSMSVYVIFEI